MKKFLLLGTLLVAFLLTTGTASAWVSFGFRLPGPPVVIGPPVVTVAPPAYYPYPYAYPYYAPGYYGYYGFRAWGPGYWGRYGWGRGWHRGHWGYRR